MRPVVTPGSPNEKTNPEIRPTTPLVLLVDDDEDQLFLFKTLLERTKCEVITADTALDALEILEQIHIDLVVCDVMMPGMDGKELMMRLRQSSSLDNLPIIAFSASEDLPSDDVLSAGANLFCPKSKTRELLEQVGRLLQQHSVNKTLLAQIRERFTH